MDTTLCCVEYDLSKNSHNASRFLKSCERWNTRLNCAKREYSPQYPTKSTLELLNCHISKFLDFGVNSLYSWYLKDEVSRCQINGAMYWLYELHWVYFEYYCLLLISRRYAAFRVWVWHFFVSFLQARQHLFTFATLKAQNRLFRSCWQVSNIKL